MAGVAALPETTTMLELVAEERSSKTDQLVGRHTRTAVLGAYVLCFVAHRAC